VITGASKPEHVSLNAAAADIALDDEILAKIEELFPD
jgi:aryl-alcohol dehydrogenase-like predicted oxidoreductase